MSEEIRQANGFFSKRYRIPVRRPDGTWEATDETCATEEEAYQTMLSRERARLSVLRLTAADKRFLKSVRIAP